MSDASKGGAQPMDTSNKETKAPPPPQTGGGGKSEDEEMKEIDRRANMITDVNERNKFYAEQAELVKLRRQSAKQAEHLKEMERKQAEEMKRVQEVARRQMEVNMDLITHFVTAKAGAGFKDVSALGESVRKNDGMIDLKSNEGQLIMAGIKYVMGQQQQHAVRQPAPQQSEMQQELSNRHLLLREMYNQGDQKMQDDFQSVEASRGGQGGGAGRELLMVERMLDEVQARGMVPWDGESTAPKHIVRAQPSLDGEQRSLKRRRMDDSEIPSGLGLLPR